jgi:hypothetical protein
MLYTFLTKNSAGDGRPGEVAARARDLDSLSAECDHEIDFLRDGWNSAPIAGSPVASGRHGCPCFLTAAS